MKKFIATENDTNTRLSRFCEKLCPTMPKSMLYKAFRNKRIKVNNKKQDANYLIQVGDVIDLYINDEFFVNDKKDETIIHNNYEYKFTPEIVYEDNNIILFYKPAGMLCHEDIKKEPCLTKWFLEYLTKKNEYDPTLENTFTPALANRLDQGTDGIVIACKNIVSLREINMFIRENLILKQYLCIISGSLKDGEYSAFHSRNLQTKKVSIFQNSVENTKPITTIFNTIDTKNNLSLIECTLVTGRTHQIRAHLAFLNHPIIGDKKYGKSVKNIDSQLLSSYKITFKNIMTDSPLNYLNNKIFTHKNNIAYNYFYN